MAKRTRVSPKTLKRQKICAVDLFCGAGGLTHGLAKAGIDVRLGVDTDPACQYPYTKNNKADFLLKPVEKLEVKDIRPYFEKGAITLLAGCAPCQTFSMYYQKATESDQRWWLLRQFARIVKELSPDLITMENVPRLSGQNVFHEFLDSLRSSGYSATYQVVNCADYGVPQRRRRLVLLASKINSVSLLSPSDFGGMSRSVRDAIGDLPAIKAGSGDPDDPLHQSAGLSSINLRRIQSSKPGGTWRDWPERLRADCHKKKTGKSYASVYGRMTWDNPSPTITTQFSGFGNGRFGHPEQNRAISLREGAILQSFPRSYRFVTPGEDVRRISIGQLIGNAVPVILGKVIGKSLCAHVTSSKAAGMRRNI